MTTMTCNVTRRRRSRIVLEFSRAAALPRLPLLSAAGSDNNRARACKIDRACRMERPSTLGNVIEVAASA
ncbi:hypothetical protein X777_11326 [Ooceraea biroi]|uniref:Uncharacterized protein n=1 Tax=Ooceraea biroi TaxID=2015173 RepID=A0A026W2A9_OOCBI|nr:hypothetical protein X777_11326 [Ooceraea biroi]